MIVPFQPMPVIQANELIRMQMLGQQQREQEAYKQRMMDIMNPRFEDVRIPEVRGMAQDPEELAYAQRMATIASQQVPSTFDPSRIGVWSPNTLAAAKKANQAKEAIGAIPFTDRIISPARTERRRIPLSPASNYGQIEADMAYKEMEEKRQMAELGKYQTMVQHQISQIGKLDEDSVGKVYESLGRSIMGAGERLGNPGLVEYGQQLLANKDLVGKTKPTGKQTTTTASYTPEDLVRIANDPDTPTRVKDALLTQAEELKTRKPNERKEMMELTYDPTGALIGAKPIFQPAPTKVNVSVSGGGSGDGRLGKFTDNEYERFYNMGQKMDALPQRVRGTARANQQARADWDTGYNDWLSRMGKSGGQAGLEAGESRADQMSLQQAVKVRDAMQPFVGNMNEQIKRIRQLAKSAPSSDAARILAMPINEAKRYIFGRSDLAAYRMYITEIEAEAGKLATGSTGSVRELSQTAQDKWAKIHDKNMPLGQMLKLLEETRTMGNMRLKEQEKVINDINKRRNRAIKKDDQRAVPTLAEWLPAARKANPGVSDKVLGEYYDQKYKGKK